MGDMPVARELEVAIDKLTVNVALRVKAERDALLFTLNRICDKVHATLSQEGNHKYAIQTLDSIDEIAKTTIAKVEGR